MGVRGSWYIVPVGIAMSDRPSPGATGGASEAPTSKDVEQLLEQVTQLTARLEKANKDRAELQDQVTQLTATLEKTDEDREELREQVASVTEELQREKTQGRTRITKLERTSANLEQQLGIEKKKNKEMAEAAAARDEHQKIQLEAMAEQVEKLRGVLKQRDEELLRVQRELLAKKDAEAGARQETDRVRPIGAVGQAAVKDTSVLQRRVTDLEIELEQLRVALENDPKFKVYMLVRETGQRTLEELSKVLGVGRLEAQRRVQELVRSGLLLLREDKVLLAQGRKQSR
jgi:chromosome segregation ATPase